MKGGHKFKAFSGQAEDNLIIQNLPAKVSIRLESLTPLLEVGDNVVAGQIIAQNDATISSPIHASISGKIRQINDTSIIIDGIDDNKAYQSLSGYAADWGTLSAQQVEELLYKSGVSGLDSDGIPTRFKSSKIAPVEVEDVIVYGVNSEAYNLSLNLLLSGDGLNKFVEGVKIFKKIMPQANFYLALSKENKKLVQKVKELTASLPNVKVCALSPKYPQEMDQIFVSTILRKKIPYGYSPANIGVISLSIQTVLQAAEAVIEGKPLIERIVALSGPCVKEKAHFKVRVGMPIGEILKNRLWQEENPYRVVINSLINGDTGEEVKDLSYPIKKNFSQIIVIPDESRRKLFSFARPGLRSDSFSRSFASFVLPIHKWVDTNLGGEERPCIKCGYCAESCPVGIIPHLLYRQKKKVINETLIRYGAFDCVNCNLCSYVCPCKIPLAKNIKEVKEKLKKKGLKPVVAVNLKGI
ncbi:4Fe-4S dicluster domain-containing protein [Candidatus Auribacterota bacterium]